ncbi:cytochrome P450 2S1-like [Cebus imitator]|uniref:cytochrome P450 2S1-like n=1 Tax=Cebus imitator TaxID=2715852 RepID=UPI001896C364|nr:cytochrome P450 2S1-like [Cebus imitator]
MGWLPRPAPDFAGEGDARLPPLTGPAARSAWERRRSRPAEMEATGTWTLLLALALLLLLTLALSGTRARGHLPPGPTPLPLLGNLLQLRPGALYSGLMRLSKKYGPVFTVCLGPWRPVVVLVGQEAVREALGGQAEEFSGRGTIAMLERTFDGHVITSRDPGKALRAQKDAGELSRCWELEEQNPHTEFTEKNMLMTVIYLLFAGTMTVSATVGYTLLLLMKYPHVQRRFTGEQL